MAYHDNLRTIPLTGAASESEEDGKIGKVVDMKDTNTTNEEDHDSESSKDEGDDFLDIKPPQASIKSKDTCHDDRKKSKKESWREIRRRIVFFSRDRHSAPERRSRQTEPRRKDREIERRSVRYREAISSTKERHYRKNLDLYQDIRIRRPVYKSKDDRYPERLEEWRQKRLLFIEKKREQDREHTDKEHIQKEREQMLDSVDVSLCSFTFHVIEQSETPIENTEKEKKGLPLAFMEEKPMDYEGKEEEDNEKDDNESSGSETEGLRLQFQACL